MNNSYFFSKSTRSTHSHGMAKQ